MENSAQESERHFRREAARTNIYLAAILVGENSNTPITIRTLSSTGALIQSRTMLEDDIQVTLARGSLRAHGSLVWREGRLGGIKFEEPINLAVWIPGTSYGGQMQVDQKVDESRGLSSPFASNSEPETPKEKPQNLTGRIAEELAFVARKLEALGDELCDDPAIVARHATKLQDIDLTTQVLGHLSRLLTSAEPGQLLGTIGMDDLRRRLERTNLP
jgi:hypothetical protein